MAAALPMAALPAWRLYFGLPMTGRRLPASGFEELMRLGHADGVVNLYGPAVAAVERIYDVRYGWTDASRAVADRFDFLRRATEIATAEPALLVVSGADDHPEFRADAEALEGELASRYRDRSCVRLHRVPDMPHNLAEPPGVEPAPQNVHAATVDAAFTSWFTEHLTSPAH